MQSLGRTQSCWVWQMVPESMAARDLGDITGLGVLRLPISWPDLVPYKHTVACKGTHTHKSKRKCHLKSSWKWWHTPPISWFLLWGGRRQPGNLLDQSSLSMQSSRDGEKDATSRAREMLQRDTWRLQGLERCSREMLGSSKHWLLSQRTWLLFPAPTWYLVS